MGSKRFFMIAMVLLVLGGLNWGYAAFYGRDFVSKVAGKKAWIVYGLVGLAALFIGFSRDTYLPFLGPTVMPCSLLQDQTPEGADTSVTLQTHPGAKVLYWATEPATQPLANIKDWRQAYLKFRNAGVVTADAQGIAVLSVRKPQPYTVPMKGRLESHIHYRICGDNGMLGRVETTFLPKEESFEPDVRNNADMYKVNYEGKYEVSRQPIAPYVGERYLMKKDIDYTYTVKPVAVAAKRTHKRIAKTCDDNGVCRDMTDEESDAFFERMRSSSMGNVIFERPMEGFETENQKEIDSIEAIKTETMTRINQMDTNGIDESPQPAGAPFQTAFYIQTQ